jgi:3-oxo-5alpha-steroid 4-dehydrogenase
MTPSEKSNPGEPKLDSAVNQWLGNSDVLIVGGGTVGISAAIDAASAGAIVLVLELASTYGGTTALSAGEIYIGGEGGTPAQRANGFEDTTEDMFNYLMMASGPNADESKVRMYSEDAIGHFDWLVEQGLIFNEKFIPEKTIIPESDACLIYTGNEEAYPFSSVANPIPCGHNLAVKGDVGGKQLMDTLYKRAIEIGVNFTFDVRVLTLITNSKGSVCGAVARIGGEECCFGTEGGVILCAGGFTMNRAMLEKHAPDLLRCNEFLGTPGDNGAGIQMGWGAGAEAINMHEGHVTLPFYPPASLVEGILINDKGQRFINEDSYHGRVGYFAMQQTGNRIYLICDSDSFERPSEFSGIEIAAAAETIAELEAELGLAENTLQNTVAVFNQQAEKGEDPLWHKHHKYLKPLKTAPYVALDCSIDRAFYPCFTLGGLNTLPSGEVLNPSGECISGLFAAGRNTCDLPRSGAGYSSGLSIADATFFGRKAGQSAAARRKNDLFG